MSKKKTNQNRNTSGQPAKAPAPRAAQTTARPHTAAATTGTGFFDKYSKVVIPACIAVITFLFLRTCIDNKLTNWDDLGYIISNPLIKDSSAQGIKNIFSVDHPVMGNYHPLTILLYAIEYSYVGLQPWLYHLDSVLLHVLVTVAVYFFTKKLTGRPVAATIAALLFGLHPMHVESIAWAAGRKDVLYGLFFVLCMTSYINYLRSSGSKRTLWYISGLILFALSLLAKSVAVTLPVTLFLIDYFEKRPLFIQHKVMSAGSNDSTDPAGKSKLNLWLFLEKVPFFGLSLLFGLLSIQAQKDVGALGSLDAHFNVLERIALGCYALVNYLWKVVVPVGLSNFYPYPLKIADALPAVYYVYPAIILILAFVVWRYGRKNMAVIFGLGFFLINIVLLLQFVPVGGAIMSDRYGYIPYLGLFFILAWIVSGYFEDKAKESTGKILLGITLVYSLVLGFVSNNRCKDWYDAVSLWQDDIEKHPEAPVGYFYLGQEYYTRYEEEANPNRKKMLGDSSLLMFNMSIQRKPDYINPIICVAELQRNYGQIDEAKNTYYKAMKINPKNESVYSGLGVVFAIKHQYDSAEYAFTTSLKLKPFSPEAHSNYANFLDITGRLDSSLKEYAIAIAQNQDAYIPYMNRARIYQRQNKLDEALKDYNMAVEKSPETGDVYMARSHCYFARGNKALALQDAQKAIELGIQADPAYMSQLK